ERRETNDEVICSRESNETNISQSSPWSALLNQATPQSCRAQNPLMARHTLTIRPYRKSSPTNEVKVCKNYSIRSCQIPTLHLELSV
ncbi:uncharacterized protein CCOS01_08535, partial [Colletotrichum costaricense]